MSAAVLALAWRLWRGGLRGRGGALAALLLAQLCLGAANVLTGLAWQTGVLHNLGAAALLLAVVDALWLSAPASRASRAAAGGSGAAGKGGGAGAAEADKAGEGGGAMAGPGAAGGAS